MKTRAGREAHCITVIGMDIGKDVFHLVGLTTAVKSSCGAKFGGWR